MTSHSSGVPRATVFGVTPSSNGARIRSPRLTDMAENSSTDYSIFVGYGSKSKRIKERWEATKRLLRFENNYAALKWLLDSFVDEYLRSKQMTDTATLTTDALRKERRTEDDLAYGRRSAVRSPPKTRFEEVCERHEPSTRLPAKSPTISKEQRPLNEQRASSSDTRTVTTNTKGYAHMPPGQYSYKYLPEYWPPYYHWSGGVPVNARVMNVPSVPGYPGYMVKTSSCSALPIRDQRSGDHLKRWNSSTAVKEEKESSDEQQQSQLATAVKLGLKTKSMPNLQFIPRDGDGVSEDEDDTSDPESQGDLVALSSSSLSMPNLHKIPGERAALLSPPARLRYEPILRDRHDMCPSSSFSMPNLQAIHGPMPDERKKTIRDFLKNRLTRDEEATGGAKTKIFNPNGYFMSSRGHDSDNKRVKQDIRRRLLQRIEAKRQNEETRKIIPEARVAGKRTSLIASEVKDHNGNSWKVPISSAASFMSANTGGSTSEHTRLVKSITWDIAQAKKIHGGTCESRIWNPADVHVKKEKITADEETPPKTSVITSTANGGSPVPMKDINAKKRNENGSSQENEEDRMSSEDGEENVDVETYKDNDPAAAADDESGDSENELGDDLSPDGKRTKRMRKPDHPRKRLKAM